VPHFLKLRPAAVAALHLVGCHTDVCRVMCLLPAAVATRPDVIIATGRSDFPNQVNNVIAFPPLFRGALDCRAK
jgi:hypothetical protein